MSKRRPDHGDPNRSVTRIGETAAILDTIVRNEPTDSVADILKVTRRYLQMDVAFVSEFVGDRRFFRYVDPPGSPALPDGSARLDEGFCKAIVDGDLPQLIPDTRDDAIPAGVAGTDTAPIGSHVGVPIRLRDDRLYGTFCCFSRHADPSLNGRDLLVMHAFADLVATQIDRALDASADQTNLRRSIEAAIAGQHRTTVFQPIRGLPGRRIIGVEALTRFTASSTRGPEAWFGDAASVGLLAELECAAGRSALAGLRELPADVYLAVNMSPSTIVDDCFPHLFESVPVERVVLEVTEHADVPNYGIMAERLAPFRQRGLRLAVDDAGAGYASLQHILNLKPDIIKLDMSLTRNVDSDPARRALAVALVNFAADVRCQLIAEGIETEAELETLRAFGVTQAQGYRLGRPAPLAEVLAAIKAA